MKDIKGYEGIYAITEDGQVWSYKRQKFIKPYKQNGYLLVTLFKDGNSKNYRIHRLVAGAYLPNPNNYPEVHHINSIRTDNRIENLAWVSKEDNLRQRKRKYKTHTAKRYATKLEELGIEFTPEQKKLIENMG